MLSLLAWPHPFLRVVGAWLGHETHNWISAMPMNVGDRW